MRHRSAVVALWILSQALALGAGAAVPGPPGVLAIPGNARATLHIIPPSNDGGLPITSYTVTSSPGGFSATAAGWPIVVTGLANGTTYTFTATAANGSGASPASAASNPVTPNAGTITPSVASQETVSLALDVHGQVYAWGTDFAGQLGQGRRIVEPTPVQVPGLPFIQQAAVYDQVIALDNTGQVWSWADLESPHLVPRDGSNSSKPARVVGIKGVIQVAAGNAVSYILKSDQTVWSLRNGPIVTQLAFPAGITKIAAHGSHVLGLRGSDGTVWASGGNSKGQLGQGNTTSTPGVVQVPGITNAVEISAGESSSMARLADNTLRFWGELNFIGISFTSPTPVTGLGGNPIGIHAGFNGIAVVRADNTVWTWTNNLTTPTQVGGMTGAAKVAYWAFRNTLLSIGTTGAISGSGDNNEGQLGQGHTNPVIGTVPVSGLTGVFTSVDIGRSRPSIIAVRNDGTVWFWGSNPSGQRGDGVAVGSNVPLAVPIPATIASISAGNRFALAVDTSGRLWGWGDNSFGALDSSLVSRSVPTLIPGASNVKKVAAGTFTSFAFIKNDNTAWINDGGTITQAAGLANIADVASGSGTYYFIDGTTKILHGMGFGNLGQMGDGTTTSRSSPAPINLGGPVKKVVAAGSNVAALMESGTVYRWGNDGFGSQLSPLQVGIFDAVDIWLADQGGAALRTNAATYGWGFTAAPQTTQGSPFVPYPIAAVGTTIGLGKSTAVFMAPSGLVRADGANSPSPLLSTVGDGTYIRRDSPVVVFAHKGSGSLDGNNWFLDLQPATPETIPSFEIPKALATSSISGSSAALGFEGSVKYKSADYGKKVNNYVIALVPPAFFTQVKNAPGLSDMARLEAKAAKAGGFVLAQLTPSGWLDVNGQLIAYASGTASAAGGASSILNSINAALVPGSRFCVGYGESADSMLTSQSLREVLVLPGTSTSTSGIPCVIGGVYVNGPASSVQGSPVTFTASVVGVNPAGTVQFRDGVGGSYSDLGGGQALFQSNSAMANASVTSSALASGVHSIVVNYSGDALNPPATTEVPKLHTVSAPLAQALVNLESPSSSLVNAEVALVATVTGNAPSGTITFLDGATPLSSPVPLVDQTAALRVSTLAAGNHTITASYSGDGSNAAGTSPPRGLVVVSQPPTSVSIASNGNPAPFGATVIVTITVTGNGTPTGNVTLRDQGVALGTQALANGAASFSLSSLPGGAHRLTADYAGDGSNTAATSAAFFQQVAAPPALLGVTASKSGLGTGTVKSNPAGIDCGATCAANFLSNSTISLEATAAAGSTFVGWSDACAGAAACALPVTVPRTVGARFEVAASGVSLAPTALAFGGQSMNTTAPAQVVTFTNNSGAFVTFSSVEAPPGYSATHNCANVGSGASCSITVSFTPTVEGAGTGNVALLFSQSGATRAMVIGVSGTGEKSLVTHYYRSILRRAPDAGGKTFWGNEALRVANLGANVNEAWYAMAQTFYFSSEYAGFNRNDNAFVTDLYNTFFNRAPDSAGLGFWAGNLGSGMPREVALAEFMFSAEFRNFAQAIFGVPTVRAELDMVMDLYRGLLTRLPDDAGFNFWVGRFRTAQCQGAAAVTSEVEAMSSAFALSAEYGARNRSAAQYVGDLYNAFLRRGGDLAGVQYWIGQVTSNAQTREQVRVAFKNSAEFQGRVNAVVAQGCMTQ